MVVGDEYFAIREFNASPAQAAFSLRARQRWGQLGIDHGSAVLRRLSALGYTSVLTATRDQLDLRDQAAVNYWFRANRPELNY